MARPRIIPIFLPHAGCPQRCVFCNQHTVAQGVPSPVEVRERIETALAHFTSRGRPRENQVAFYGGSFTAIPGHEQRAYLKEVQPFLSSGKIDSIRVSTRPDALDEEALALLKGYGVKTVEVGAQSMVDEVIALSQRGHTAGDTVASLARLKRKGFEVGVHLMIGLPGDSLSSFLRTLEQVIILKPDFVRIHPTLVLKGAPLESFWNKGEYVPLSLGEAIQWLKEGALALDRGSLPVARMGLQPSRELEAAILAGPYHPALHQLVHSEIFYDMAACLLQGLRDRETPMLLCHPKEISNARGQGNSNLLKLKERFGLRTLVVEGQEGIPLGTLVLRTDNGNHIMQRSALNG